VEVFLALMARADDEEQFWCSDIEAKDIPGRTDGNDELAKCWSLTDLAVRAAVSPARRPSPHAQRSHEAGQRR